MYKGEGKMYRGEGKMYKGEGKINKGEGKICKRRQSGERIEQTIQKRQD